MKKKLIVLFATLALLSVQTGFVKAKSLPDVPDASDPTPVPPQNSEAPTSSGSDFSTTDSTNTTYPFQLPTSGSTDFTKSVDLKQALPNIANNILSTLLTLAGILAVFYLIWAGIQYITSAGDANKAKMARGGIINVMIGIVIIISAYFLVRFAVSLGTTLITSSGY